MIKKPCYGVRNERRTEHLPTLQTLQTRWQQHISEHQSGAGSMAQNVELESILYAIGMESNTGYRHMEMLCDLLAVPYPPKNIGKPAPEKLVSTKETQWHS